jgi:hypothetical protein
MEWYLLWLIGLIGLYWSFSMAARELALHIARQACQEMEALLLDETVSLNQIRLRRDTNQRLRLRRHFAFQYMDRHANRYEGAVILLGNRLENLILASTPLPDDADQP